MLGYAWDAAQARHRRLALVDKANALGHSGALWRRVADEHRRVRPETEFRALYVDACAMEMVRDPGQFDVIATNNMFGDILSDLGAQLIGGMGMAPSANINPVSGAALFEPVHGSAPDIAGRGRANPFGAILSASLLLRHLKLEQLAAVVDRAVAGAIDKGECTVDLGGKLSTEQTGDAVALRVRREL